MNIPISSPLAYIGFLLLAIGVFMVLAGLDIIRIQQVTVRQGTRTWAVGLIFAVVGMALLYPELFPARPRVAADAGAGTAASGEPAADAGPTQESAAAATALGAGWRSVSFKVPNDSLWEQSAEGRYTARGMADTFAWSEETFEGDIELLVDISSTSGKAEANVLLFGDGEGFSPGVLIFSVADDYQKIVSGTVYDDGTFLGDSGLKIDFGDQEKARVLGIRVLDGVATLSVDGRDVVTAALGDGIGSRGRIGLYKYAGRPDVTFSNVRVRIPVGD